MAVHDSTTFALLVNLEALSTSVFSEFPAQTPEFYRAFVKFYDSNKQQEKFAEMGGVGYAIEKKKGSTVTYQVIADGKAKTVTPLTFMLGVRFWRELMMDSVRTGSWDFAVKGAEALMRAMWAQRELRTANLFNNATSTSGRYGVPAQSDGTTEAWASNSHTAKDGGTQDNLYAADVSEVAVQDVVAMLRQQKDMQGIPSPTFPVLAWASTPKNQMRLKEILQPLIAARPVIAGGSGGDVIAGANSVDVAPVSSNILAQEYQVQVHYSPFFTGNHWGMLGPNHGVGYLANEAFETATQIDFDTTDFKEWVRERFETFTWKFRDAIIATGY